MRGLTCGKREEKQGCRQTQVTSQKAASRGLLRGSTIASAVAAQVSTVTASAGAAITVLRAPIPELDSLIQESLIPCRRRTARNE